MAKAKAKPHALTEQKAAQLKKSVPDTFKTGRDAGLQLSNAERTLFSELEAQESGKVLITGLTKKVKELDLTAFTFAAAQLLYNQSYQCGNESTASGVSRKVAPKATEQTGTTQYNGEIIVTLNELCLKAYGSATTELRTRMKTLIDTIHDTPVKIKYPNGDEMESTLCAKMGKYIRKEDGAIYYDLYLNPIFGSRLQSQFGELPQDIIMQLENACKKRKQRKQPAHYLLLRWLCLQDKRKKHTLQIGTLIRELRMEEYYRENAGKAEKQLLSIFEIMKDLGILAGYWVEKRSISRNRLRITKVTFTLNPDYIRLSAKPAPNQPAEEPKP